MHTPIVEVVGSSPITPPGVCDACSGDGQVDDSAGRNPHTCPECDGTGRDPAPSWPRILTGVLVALFVGAVLAAPVLMGGCATLGANSTARAVVAAAAAPAESLAVDALEAELAKLPADPVAFHAWLVDAGLSGAEALEVEAMALKDAREGLAGLIGYIDGGAIGRLALSGLAGEDPRDVGPREAARYLLARAQARSAGEQVLVVPVTSEPAEPVSTTGPQ